MSESNTDKLAVASFILGISSFCLGPFSGIPTMILASLAYSRIKRNGTYGKNLALAGWIMGAMPTLLVLVALFWPHKDRLGMRILF